MPATQGRLAADQARGWLRKGVVTTHYANLGALGAVAFMALSGMLLDRLRAATSATKIAARLNVHATH